MAGVGGTVVDLLGAMALVSNELELGAGEHDEARAVEALKHAQHYFETLAATYADLLQDTVNVVTVADTETTAFPSTLLRIDGIQLLDAAGYPSSDIMAVHEVGGHAPSLPWPLSLISSSASGGVGRYYASSQNFYWQNRPDAAYTFRIYGLIEKARFSSRNSDVNYPYRLHLPFAVFAVKLLALGLDDSSLDLDRLAAQVFAPALKQLSQVDRSGPTPRFYTQNHDT